MTDRIESLYLGSLSSSSRAVVKELLAAGALPRAELARRLGHSPSSLTKITRPLLDSRVITEEKAHGGYAPGRPGTPLAVAAERFQFLGFKITQDALFRVRTNASGTVQESFSVELENTDVESVVALIVDQVNEIAEKCNLQAVGIGSAGKMKRYDDRVRHNLYLGWDDVPLAQIIQERTGIPTVVSSDTRALTAGVQWSGPGRGHANFAVVTIGIGVGLGLVLDDRVLAGATGGAGFVGHLQVSESGPVCRQGHRGCVSSYLNAESIISSIAVPHGLPALDLEGACTLAADGDKVARKVFEEAGYALGVLMANLVNILGLPLIILTGDGLPALPYLREAMDKSLRTHCDVNADKSQIRVFASDFDEWARGAAVVACQWTLEWSLQLPPTADISPQHP